MGHLFERSGGGGAAREQEAHLQKSRDDISAYFAQASSSMPEIFQPTAGCFGPGLAEFDDASSYLLDPHFLGSTTCAPELLGGASPERSRHVLAAYPRLRGGGG
jgi:hypothetical protein